MPDFTGNVRGVYDYGHVQVAGIARKLTFQDGVGPTFDEFGYGVNVTGTWHPWAQLFGCPMCEDKSPIEKCRFLGQYAQGKGINRYIQDVNGLGLDATFDPVNGFEAVDATGWFVAYEHWWAQKWISTFSYGATDNDLPATVATNTYQSTNYITANLIWLPVERMGVGFEYIYGTRTNFDGQDGEAHRLQMGFQYKF